MTLCINPHCDKPQNSDNAQFCQNCQSSLLLKQRYRATKVLGGGGFGKTYEASDLGTPNKVIKVLINNSPKAVELFKREAEVLSQLSNPNIPRVEPNSYIVYHPNNSDEPVHCLVMEKVEGLNLQDYLKRLRQPIDSETAERWLKELVLILQEVHEKKSVHRDIKPQNIIFRPNGRLALIDFGSVREGTGTQLATSVADGGKTEFASDKTTIGSVGYMALEQMNGEPVSQSDFYSLGRTFVFLLTGKEPSTISYDVDNDVLQWRKYAPNVKPELAELLDRMQKGTPNQRPKNADEILQKLGSYDDFKGLVQGEDIEIEVKITAQEAAAGITKDITFERTVYPSGSVSSKRRENMTLTVKVPPGCASGKRLCFAGQGNDGLNGGTPGSVYVSLNITSFPQPEPAGVDYAAFWKRATASAVDIFIVAVLLLVVWTLPQLNEPTRKLFSQVIIFVMLTLFALNEASENKATLGKLMMAIVVTNGQGQKISDVKSVVRNLIKYASIAFFGLGILYFIFSVLFTRKKQSLHDLLIGSVVVRV